MVLTLAERLSRRNRETYRPVIGRLDRVWPNFDVVGIPQTAQLVLYHRAYGVRLIYRLIFTTC